MQQLQADYVYCVVINLRNINKITNGVILNLRNVYKELFTVTLLKFSQKSHIKTLC